jgi:hypothetical protein
VSPKSILILFHYRRKKTTSDFVGNCPLYVVAYLHVSDVTYFIEMDMKEKKWKRKNNFCMFLLFSSSDKLKFLCIWATSVGENEICICSGNSLSLGWNKQQASTCLVVGLALNVLIHTLFQELAVLHRWLSCTREWNVELPTYSRWIGFVS